MNCIFKQIGCHTLRAMKSSCSDVLQQADSHVHTVCWHAVLYCTVL